MSTINFEKSLIDDCLHGSRSAQFQLYNQNKKEIYGTCVRMMGNVEDANEAIQKTFIDVFSKLSSFRGEAPIRFWIKRIGFNNCLKLLKNRKHTSEVNDEVLLVEDVEEPGREYCVDRIKMALKELAPGYRTILNLYLFEGYDHREISEILGISIGTSKSQYSRAKKQLKNMLIEEKWMN